MSAERRLREGVESIMRRMYRRRRDGGPDRDEDQERAFQRRSSYSL